MNNSLISRIFYITIEGKTALKSLLESYKYFSVPLSNDPIRVNQLSSSPIFLVIIRKTNFRFESNKELTI